MAASQTLSKSAPNAPVGPTPRPLDRRPSVLGRLLSLSSTLDSTEEYLASSQRMDNPSSVVIHFPSMPDVVELAREADYRVTTAPYTPDGIHLYKQTMPLRIPISFSLHSADPFCSKGGLSLLIMAAKLHSLVLPINNASDRSKIGVTVNNYYQAPKPPETATAGQPPSPPEGVSVAGSSETEASIAFNNTLGQATTAFPPACLLDLISVGDRAGAPGIRCYGYVSGVSVKLRGPWLRGEVEYGPRGIRNVPTAADFNFVFVHAPGFSNYFAGVATSAFQLSGLSAFSDDVLTSLYNTVALTQGQPAPNRYINQGESSKSLNPAGVVDPLIESVR